MADESTEQNEIQDEAVEQEAEAVEPVAEVDAEPAETEAEAEPVAEVEPEPEREPEPEPEPEAAEPQPEAEPVAEAEAEPLADAAEEPSAEAAEEPAADADGAEAAEDAEAAAPARRKKRKRVPRSLRRQRTTPQREKPAERKAITRLPKPEHGRGRRQERQGAVVSAAGDKTIVVRVDTVKAHRMYKKVIRRSTRLHAHDEQNEAKVGDIVRIVETRPLSRLKRWRLQEIVEAAK